MARRITWIGFVLWCAGVCLSARASDLDGNWKAWRYLPVQDGGRIKPFDSLARETVRGMTGRESIVDPEMGERLEPVAAYLTLVCGWQGWDAPIGTDSGHAQRPARQYFGRHRGDDWDRLSWLPIEESDLRELLRLPPGTRTISPHDLSQAKIEVPEVHEQRAFVSWAERLGQVDAARRSPLERHAWALLQRYWDYQRHRMGDRLLVAPSPDPKRARWMSLSELVAGRFDDATDPTGQLRAVQQGFAAARKASRDGAREDLAASFETWLRAVSALSQQDAAEFQAKLRWEVWSNHWVPLRWAWICLLLAACCFVWPWRMASRRWLAAGWVLSAAGCLALLTGVAIRMVIAGRWLGADMYESVVLVGAGIALLGLLGAVVERGRCGVGAAACASALLLAAADLCPRVLDPTLHPLPVSLRGTPWFVVHVHVTAISFAFLAWGAAIGNLQLGMVLCAPAERVTISRLTQMVDLATRLGLLSLAMGLVAGGLWAEAAWGSFWAWDAKEVWTLIVIVAYLAVYQARLTGWLQDFGTAAGSVMCFQLVVLAWYGVNCVWPSEQHNFGFSAGPAWWILPCIAAQTIVVMAAGCRVAWQAHVAREEQRLAMELPTSHPMNVRSGDRFQRDEHGRAVE